MAELRERVSGLETSLATLTQPSRERAAALAQKVATLTTMLKSHEGERYAWGGAGLLLGLSLCASLLYRLATMASLRH